MEAAEPVAVAHLADPDQGLPLALGLEVLREPPVRRTRMAMAAATAIQKAVLITTATLGAALVITAAK